MQQPGKLTQAISAQCLEPKGDANTIKAAVRLQ